MLGVERPTDALMRVSDETVRPILPTVLVHPSIHQVYFRQKSIDNNRDKSNDKKHTSLATKHQ